MWLEQIAIDDVAAVALMATVVQRVCPQSWNEMPRGRWIAWALWMAVFVAAALDAANEDTFLWEGDTTLHKVLVSWLTFQAVVIVEWDLGVLAISSAKLRPPEEFGSLIAWTVPVTTLVMVGVYFAVWA